MNQTFDKTERAAQKTILRALYPDYDPKRHDVFVIRYNQDRENAALVEYWKRRGVILKDTP